MTFPHTFSVRCLIMAICTVIPIKGWAEVTVPPPGFFPESLTVNYALAIRGDHASIPSDRQRAPSRSKESTHVFNSFSKTLNTQSSSSVQQEEEQRPSSFPIVVDEEVPSYIIHEPALHHPEAGPQEVVQPAFDEPQVKEQSSSDSQYPINSATTFEQPPLYIQRDRLPSLSRFGWPLIEQNHDHISPKDSLAISPQLPFEAPFPGLSMPQIYLARFADVFHPDWMPSDLNSFTKYGPVPLIINDAVAKNLRYFQEGIPDRFQSYLDRFHHYKEVVEPIFREFGLPSELMYLSLVESGFQSASLFACTGIWTLAIHESHWPHV